MGQVPERVGRLDGLAGKFYFNFVVLALELRELHRLLSNNRLRLILLLNQLPNRIGLGDSGWNHRHQRWRFLDQ